MQPMKRLLAAGSAHPVDEARLTPLGDAIEKPFGLVLEIMPPGPTGI